MKLAMTLLVRNEEDILDWNLRFHFERGVSFVIATDNNSTDTTPDILREYEKEGRLHFMREEADDYSQSEWVTNMARMAASQYGADWVINNDADEFWWPHQGDLRSTLAALPDGTGALSCQRLNFQPIDPVGDASAPFWKRMIWRQRRATNALGLALPGKVCHRGTPQVHVAQGNHAVEGLAGAVVASDAIEILHYPMRTYAQFETKIRFGGAAYQRNQKLPKDVGATWRHLYSLHCQGALRSWYEKQTHVPFNGAGQERLVADMRLHDYFLGPASRPHNAEGVSSATPQQLCARP
jgi:hypothetical protein